MWLFIGVSGTAVVEVPRSTITNTKTVIEKNPCFMTFIFGVFRESNSLTTSPLHDYSELGLKCFRVVTTAEIATLIMCQGEPPTSQVQKTG